jgi:hypothetical protein
MIIQHPDIGMPGKILSITNLAGVETDLFLLNSDARQRAPCKTMALTACSDVVAVSQPTHQNRSSVQARSPVVSVD